MKNITQNKKHRLCIKQKTSFPVPENIVAKRMSFYDSETHTKTNG